MTLPQARAAGEPGEQEAAWNIFAATLMEILDRHHHATISLLDDRAQVPPAVVKRLQDSLRYQGQFPVLNPDELDRAASAFALESAERRLLVAAVIATGIQAKLTKRIGARTARQAAVAILPIIAKELATAIRDHRGPLAEVASKIRHDPPVTAPGVAPLSFAERHYDALAAIDRATFDLYALTQLPDTEYEYTRAAQSAYQDCLLALALLEARPEPPEQEGETADASEWAYWHTRAANGAARAKACGGARRDDVLS